jgi:hypothetical protein
MKKVLVVAIGAFLLCSCVPHSHQVSACLPDKYLFGFWGGLWHGLMSPLTFLISIFDGNITIYAVNNTGRWYELGFVLGAGVLGGGAGRVIKK